MEKYRVYFEVLKKYHFWVLCGLIVVLSFVSWFLATADQENRFVTRKGQIENQLRVVSSIGSNVEHPSEKYIQQIRNLQSGPLASQVTKASTRLYQEQRDANPLPKIYPDAEAQEGFKAAFESIWRPMEDIEKLPPGALREVYRSRYRNHIEEHFPPLFELIERRTVEGGADDSRAGGGPGNGMQPMGMGGKDPGEESKKTKGIVDWFDADQKIKKFLAPFRSHAPSTLEVMLAQEDLWIYETLLKVVRNTNNVARDQKHYQKPANHKVARIKQILAMDIGKDAVQSWSKCEKSLFSLPGDGGGPGLPMAGAGPQPAGHGGPAMSSPNSGGSPLADRYVDDNGQPLADPSQQPFGEFRMMPIDLRVVIEQKEIPRLLAECANSAMRIDVRRVRILVQEPPPVDLGAPDAAPGGGKDEGDIGPAMGPGGHGGMGHGISGGDSGSGKGEATYVEESADAVYKPVPVEVQGIIYIYNPPRAQDSGDAAGGNGGQAASAAPLNTNPAGGAAPAFPAGGTPLNPSPLTPGRGGRP